ncbi:MAG: alpha/beta fold hydrolase [Gammaproteobacteria bacterium]
MNAIQSPVTRPIPAWFTRALAAPRESRYIEVAGCSIHYLRWGDPSRPGMILIAGSGGHAHWFSHVAPMLADQFNVVAIDSGGNGDSGHREAYSMDLVIEEIMAVCADAGMFAADIAPIVVGHSMGGQFAVRAAIARGEAMLGVIAVDALRYARLDKDPAYVAFAGGRPASRPRRYYPDEASIVARFRFNPPPEVDIEGTYVVEHIARNAVRQTPEGWTWKYDDNFGSVMGIGLELKDALAGLRCRAAAIYGETSHLSDETVIESMERITNGRVPVFVIPGTSHYCMIDNPLAFVAAIRGVAVTWVAEARAVRDP